jgi:protein-disulfide isomerase
MNYILNLKSNNSPVSKEDIKNFTLGFYSARVEEIQFPESNLVIGNPNAPITIYAFTDFLCSACYEFYKVEKYLLSKFKDKIKVVYFNFPLDKDCNVKMARSVYPNSCSASKAMIQNGYSGNFPAYLFEHFKDYKSIHEKYNEEKAISILPGNMDKIKFQEGMKSQAVSDMLKSHIIFAEKIGISSTPTMFISGRRMSGVAPKEMMEELIKKELERTGK